METRGPIRKKTGWSVLK